MATKKNYYQDLDNVQNYISMSEGIDGKNLIDILKKHLQKNASVLELGMGPGKDLELLSKEYTTTGSDISDVFLNRYSHTHPDADLIKLDAQKLNTERKFDCIYSNKVLHHLTSKQLKKSIKKQKKLLNDQGLLFHSFWRGDLEESYNGLKFVYYTKDELYKYFSEDYEVVDIQTYSEMEEEDSIYVILKNQ